MTNAVSIHHGGTGVANQSSGGLALRDGSAGQRAAALGQTVGTGFRTSGNVQTDANVAMELAFTTVALRGPRRAAAPGVAAISHSGAVSTAVAEEEVFDDRQVQIVYGVGPMEGTAILMGYVLFTAKFLDEIIQSGNRYWTTGQGAAVIPKGWKVDAVTTVVVPRRIITSLVAPAETRRLYMLGGALVPNNGPMIPRASYVISATAALGVERWRSAPSGLPVPSGHSLAAVAGLRVGSGWYSALPGRPPAV